MSIQETFAVQTQGRATYDITTEVEKVVTKAGVKTGLCHIFIHHTSASLIFCENADPSVRHDLETFMARLAPDGDPAYQHCNEGADDMPAHIRTVITQTEVTAPITQGRLGLGTWQSVYLWEHRTRPHRRQVTVTILG